MLLGSLFYVSFNSTSRVCHRAFKFLARRFIKIDWRLVVELLHVDGTTIASRFLPSGGWLGRYVDRSVFNVLLPLSIRVATAGWWSLSAYQGRPVYMRADDINRCPLIVVNIVRITLLLGCGGDKSSLDSICASGSLPLTCVQGRLGLIHQVCWSGTSVRRDSSLMACLRRHFIPPIRKLILSFGNLVRSSRLNIPCVSCIGLKL